DEEEDDDDEENDNEDDDEEKTAAEADERVDEDVSSEPSRHRERDKQKKGQRRQRQHIQLQEHEKNQQQQQQQDGLITDEKTNDTIIVASKKKEMDREELEKAKQRFFEMMNNSDNFSLFTKWLVTEQSLENLLFLNDLMFIKCCIIRNPHSNEPEIRGFQTLLAKELMTEPSPRLLQASSLSEQLKLFFDYYVPSYSPLELNLASESQNKLCEKFDTCWKHLLAGHLDILHDFMTLFDDAAEE
ncbi:hypothetical protein RFI_12767, partial [Reticulomyxa filosa]